MLSKHSYISNWRTRVGSPDREPRLDVGTAEAAISKILFITFTCNYPFPAH
jgi:hypothetical protein